MRVVTDQEGGIVRRVLVLDESDDEVAVMMRFLSHLGDSGYSRGRLEDLVGPRQLGILSAQPLGLLSLLGGGALALAIVDLAPGESSCAASPG